MQFTLQNKLVSYALIIEYIFQFVGHSLVASDLSWFLAETCEEARIGCAAELWPFGLALFRHLPPGSFYLLLSDGRLEGLEVLAK